VYSGPEVMNKFYEHVLRESEVISGILANDRDMTLLTATQQTDYEDATTCAECGEAFTKSNHKVRQYDHITGQYLFSACNSCNLTLKMPNQKRENHERSSTKQKGKVVFHNLKSYDAHFVIKHFKKRYVTRHIDQDEDDDIYEQEEKFVSYGNIRVISLNGEKYLSFQVGNLRFIDSFSFSPRPWTTSCRCF